MANITKQEFVPLNISGKNYLSWAMDVEMHLESMGLGKTIVINNTETTQDRAKAMIFLRHHLDEGLKYEYLTVKNPYELWNNLKERFDHLRLVVLPKARYDWLNLRLQDFKSVTEYNSAIFKITSQLKLCGEKVTDEDMLEKTFSTFHVTNVLLQQQYREKGFKRYSDLIACLLLAEQNNELLLKNHESRPTGASPFPEVNATQSSNFGRGRGRGRGGNRGKGRGRGRSCGKYVTHDNENCGNDNHGKKRSDPPKLDHYNKEKKVHGDKCYRCGMEGHWSNTCRTAKHLVQLYQASQEKPQKEVETNLVDQKGVETNLFDQKDGYDDLNIDMPLMSHLDVADFFNDTA